MEAGADVNNCDTWKQVPLHFAAVSNNEAIARLLLEKKPNVDFLNEDEFSPLHVAAAAGNLAVCRLLLAHGADPTLVNIFGKTPIDLLQREWDEFGNKCVNIVQPRGIASRTGKPLFL